jgi:hypothetical protein
MSRTSHLTSSKVGSSHHISPLFTRFTKIAHFLFFVFCVLPSPAEALTYYYTGASETAQVAYLSQARMRMDAHPKCKGDSCHVLAWTVLWDANATSQYVEAGIGYVSRFQCPKKASVGLWWASPQSPSGTRVACVPKGTEVKVTVYREDGAAGVLATWEWEGGEVSQWIDTPGWIVGPGIHPTKIEVCSTKDEVTPSPVSMTVSDVQFYNADTQVFLQQTPPYVASPESTVTTFSVNY